jgi:hypothetical protein
MFRAPLPIFVTVFVLCWLMPASAPAETQAPSIDQLLQDMEQINRPKSGAPACSQSSPGSVGAAPGDSGIDCVKEVDQFCDLLYDPKNPLGYGNANLGTPENPIRIRYGKDANDNTYAFLEHSKAKIQAIDRFPPDFAGHLKKNHYQKALDQLLKTRWPTNQKDRIRMREITDRASEIYNDAWEDALAERKEKLHPGYLKMRPLPPEWEVEFERLETQMSLEIHRAIWKEHPGWKTAQVEFEKVKKAFLSELSESTDIPADLKPKWIERIKTVEIKAPGSEEYLLGGSCNSTENNGMYNAAYHVFYLCGGKITTDVFTRTIAHELSHSIGESRSRQLALTQEGIGKDFLSLTKALCEKQPLGCSSLWIRIREDLTGTGAKKTLLKPLESYESEAQTLRECLQYDPPHPDLKSDEVEKYIKKTANDNARISVARNANRGLFLRSTKPDIPTKDGTVKNLGYLNPCGGDPFIPQNNHLDAALRTFYSAEYQCRTETDPAEKMEAAIQVARNAQIAILEKMIPMGGRFSNDPDMISEGLSEDSEERFADWMGARVHARVLRSEPRNRRLDLLKANLATFCDEPSLAKSHPAEADQQKTHDPEPHSLNGPRRREILTRPLREAVGCKTDDLGMDDLGKECGF